MCMCGFCYVWVCVWILLGVYVWISLCVLLCSVDLLMCVCMCGFFMCVGVYVLIL